jgi:hydrogenase-4 component F
MLLALVLVPAAAAAASLLVRSNLPRRLLLVAGAAGHAGLVAACFIVRPPSVGGVLSLDELGLVFLAVASLLFLAVSISAVDFLGRESGTTRTDPDEGMLFDNSPEALFTACLLGFLSAMTLVSLSAHLGLLWVGVEATTLLSAPLISYHRHHRSLEATWKYLLVCSVGIAIALLGTYFLAAAGSAAGGPAVGLTLPGLVARAGELDVRWLKAAFLLLIVGYGTKMGLAPLHTWLPDAHSESPSIVSALLSGALLNCAFLAVLRIQAVCAAAGIGEFGRQTLLAFGILSMAVAAVYVIGQADYKRLLAYSSVENMGILAVGIGLGGGGTWGALFHAVNHSLVKAALFLVAGNILAVYGTKKAADVRGLWDRLPVSGALWIAGFLALAGVPPFGAFWSELAILRAAVASGSWFVVVAFSILLAAIFVGMVTIFTGMVQGEEMRSRAAPGEMRSRAAPGEMRSRAAPGESATAAPAGKGASRETVLQVAAPIGLLALAAGIGVFLPPRLGSLLAAAARLLGA